MAELIDKWTVVGELITLQNNYTFFKNEWDAERLYREIAKLEMKIGKTQGLEVVQCKDCKYWVHIEDGIGDCSNGRFHLDGHPDPSMNADDYCVCGERRQGE